MVDRFLLPIHHCANGSHLPALYAGHPLQTCYVVCWDFACIFFQTFQKLPQIAVHLLPTVSKHSVTVQVLACGIVTETILGKDFQMKFFDIQAVTS